MCNALQAPHFSPDGNLILYLGDFPFPTCGDNSEPGLQIVDTLGNVDGAFIQDGTVLAAASWSADGQRFAFSSDELLDGNNLYESTAAPEPDDFVNASWETSSELTHGMSIGESASSPDGEHIAFIGRPFDGTSPTFLYVMDRDGSNVKPLTSGPGVGGVLSYSPDGTLLAIDHGFMNVDGTAYTVVNGCPCQFAWR